MKWLSFLNQILTVKLTRIFLTDDHTILLDGLVNILKGEEGVEVIGTASNVSATLDEFTQKKVDLLVTDYNLPDNTGLYLVQKIKAKYPATKIIVLSMHEEPHLVKEILKAGVEGYVLKKDSHAELMTAIRAVRDGKIYLSSEVNAMLVQGLSGVEEQKLLTEREREILALIAKEYTNKDIAKALFISERTVETHRKNIFRKAGTNNLVGLIKFAYANRLI